MVEWNASELERGAVGAYTAIGEWGRGGIHCNWGVGPWRHVNDHNKFVVMLPLGHILDSLNTDSQHTCECIKSMRSNQPITFAHAESKHQTEQAQRLLINEEASSEHTCHKKSMRCEHETNHHGGKLCCAY